MLLNVDVSLGGGPATKGSKKKKTKAVSFHARKAGAE
jgi:hypothetical protein